MGLFSRVAGNFVKQRVSNTKTAFQLIVEDFKKYILTFKWVFLGFSLITLVYGMFTNTSLSNLIISGCLIGLLVVYSILDAILKRREKPNPTKKLRIIYAWMKIILNGAALGSTLYALYSSTANDTKPLEIVLATLTLIMFVLKVLLEISLEVFSSKWEFLKTAMIMDAKEHPGTSGKIFSPFVGDIEQAEVKESYARRIQQKQEEDEYNV